MKNLLIIVAVFTFSMIVFAQSKSVDITKIPDGKYIGTYSANYFGMRGEYIGVVTVAGGKLTDVTLTKCAHRSGPVRGKAQFNKMIAANKIDADGVTGATWKGVVTDALTKMTLAK